MTKTERILDNRLGQIEVAIRECRAALVRGNLKRMERRYEKSSRLTLWADQLVSEVMQDGDAE